VPPWLTRITEKIYEESGLFPSSINHVLINEYLPNQGIMVCPKSSLVHLQAFLHSSFSSFFKPSTSDLQYNSSDDVLLLLLSVYNYHLMSVKMLSTILECIENSATIFSNTFVVNPTLST
jgi:hypothetical protein